MFRAVSGFFSSNAARSRLARSSNITSFSSKTLTFNQLSKNHGFLRHISHIPEQDERNLKEITFVIEPTKKEHLKEIQDQLGNVKFSFNSERDNPLKIRFIYSNDFYRHGYINTMNKCFTTPWVALNYQLGDFLRAQKPKTKIGIVIGNGAIFSFLPEIQASDILLLDKEPVVHLFVLYIRKLLLENKDFRNFSSVKKTLIEKINQLAELIMPAMKYELENEMERLGSQHFLANKYRLLECIDALLKKDLIPVNIDLFSEASMADLRMLLFKYSCEISYMNLSNIAEFDKKDALYPLISQMPFAKHFNVFATSGSSHNSCCYHLTSLCGVKDMIASVRNSAFKNNDIINMRFRMPG